MKVKVNIKHMPTSQVEYYLNEALSDAQADLADAYEKMERIHQKNKDLRLAESRALSDKKKAEDDFYNMKRNYTNVCAERDNLEASHRQVVNYWLNAQEETRKAQEEIKAMEIELRDREERISILEQRIAFLENQEAAYNEEKNEWMTKYCELEAQKKADDEKCAKVCDACNEVYEEVLTERNHLREEVARLTNERDTAVHENTELTFQINNLDDELEAVNNIKNEYAEQIDELRKQLSRTTPPAFINMWNLLKETGMIVIPDEPTNAVSPAESNQE